MSFASTSTGTPRASAVRKRLAVNRETCITALVFNKAYHLQMIAHAAVTAALAKGTLTRRPCEECGAVSQAHHDSYYPERWLDVRWLCAAHHRQWHARNEPEWPSVFEYHPSDEPQRSYHARGGRPPRPWLRKQTQTWYVTIKGRAVNLGPDPEKAQEKFRELVARQH